MGWISWLCPGINLKRWLLLFAVGVLYVLWDWLCFLIIS